MQVPFTRSLISVLENQQSYLVFRAGCQSTPTIHFSLALHISPPAAFFFVFAHEILFLFMYTPVCRFVMHWNYALLINSAKCFSDHLHRRFGSLDLKCVTVGALTPGVAFIKLFMDLSFFP